MRPLQAHCHLGLGMLYAKIGDREQAQAELSTTLTLFRTMEMTFWLTQARGYHDELIAGSLTMTFWGLLALSSFSNSSWSLL